MPRPALIRQSITERQPRAAEQDGVVLHGRHQSPYLNTREAVAYLRLGSLSALYYHIDQNRLPSLRRGRTRLFDVRELDAWLRGTNSVELMRRKVRG